jgi:hypothetical protein
MVCECVWNILYFPGIRPLLKFWVSTVCFLLQPRVLIKNYWRQLLSRNTGFNYWNWEGVPPMNLGVDGCGLLRRMERGCVIGQQHLVLVLSAASSPHFRWCAQECVYKTVSFSETEEALVQASRKSGAVIRLWGHAWECGCSGVALSS